MNENVNDSDAKYYIPVLVLLYSLMKLVHCFLRLNRIFSWKLHRLVWLVFPSSSDAFAGALPRGELRFVHSECDLVVLRPEVERRVECGHERALHVHVVVLVPDDVHEFACVALHSPC